MVQGGVEEDVVVESKAARRLAKRVDRLIKQADFVLCELQTKNERAHVSHHFHHFPPPECFVTFRAV